MKLLPNGVIGLIEKWGADVEDERSSLRVVHRRRLTELGPRRRLSANSD